MTNRLRRRNWNPHHNHVVPPGPCPGPPTKICTWIPCCLCLFSSSTLWLYIALWVLSATSVTSSGPFVLWHTPLPCWLCLTTTLSLSLSPWSPAPSFPLHYTLYSTSLCNHITWILLPLLCRRHPIVPLFHPSSDTHVATGILECLADNSAQTTVHHLKLNHHKTELLLNQEKTAITLTC